MDGPNFQKASKFFEIRRENHSYLQLETGAKETELVPN